jgi:2,4-dienoyl-CoA reductase-like NADH-dependent reductase (Old Yellow Enzyme family)
LRQQDSTIAAARYAAKGQIELESKLFSPLKLREVEFRNRIFVSPMCQYSCVDGMPTDWHLVHLGSRAVGGAGLVIVEASAVSAEGRISPGDIGIWNARQTEAFKRIASFIEQQGAVPGIQLAHAGRKASTAAPWKGGGPVGLNDGGWQTMAPSSIPFAEGYPTPRELDNNDLTVIEEQFVNAARRAQEAGFKVCELHLAHGYLMHQFLSPLTNQRKDEFGGDLQGRMKFPLRVVKSVRDVWPAAFPLFVRISATDWVDGGWDLAQSVQLAHQLREAGVDLIDCSSGGLVSYANILAKPGYQVPFAETIRRESRIATGAVGLITEPQQAEDILVRGEADAVLLARAMLRDPYWPMHAAKALAVDIPWPVQYERAKR